MGLIENSAFEFAKRFPHSRKKDYFAMLEGRVVRKDPAKSLGGESERVHQFISGYNSALNRNL